MTLILHITTEVAWQTAIAAGEYRADSLESEGFIHCSTATQVLMPANQMYAGRSDLILLMIDPAKLTAKLIFEDCYESGHQFPHIYGPLNLDAVTGFVLFPPNPDGTFSLPADLPETAVQPTMVMRVARPTDNLAQISQMYQDGLGFALLGHFEDHMGFDGAIIGHPKQRYHLEFTHHRGVSVGKASSQDNLLVFYLPNVVTWQETCTRMERAGFKPVGSYNPYWDAVGKTFEDVDGYRVVLQNRAWSA